MSLGSLISEVRLYKHRDVVDGGSGGEEQSTILVDADFKCRSRISYSNNLNHQWTVQDIA